MRCSGIIAVEPSVSKTGVQLTGQIKTRVSWCYSPSLCIFRITLLLTCAWASSVCVCGSASCSRHFAAGPATCGGHFVAVTTTSEFRRELKAEKWLGTPVLRRNAAQMGKKSLKSSRGIILGRDPRGGYHSTKSRLRY